MIPLFLIHFLFLNYQIDNLHNLHIEKVEKHVNFSEHFSISRIVKLNSEHGFVGKIAKIKKIKNEVYILDSQQSQIIVFDLSGNLLKKFPERHLGFNDRLEITDFEYDAERNAFLLLSNANYAFYIYSSDFKFVKKIKLDFAPVKIAHFDKNILGFYNAYATNRNNNLILTDFNGKIIKEEFEYPNNTPEVHFAFSGNLKNSGRSILYSDALSSKVYRLNENHKIVGQFKVNLGAKGWKEQDRFNFDLFDKRFMSRDNPVSYITSNYYQVDDLFVYGYVENMRLKLGFYDISKRLNYNEKSFSKSAYYRLFKHNIPVGATSDEIIFALSPDTWYYAQYDRKNWKDELKVTDAKTLIEYLDEFDQEDNPILLFVTLKD